MLVWAGAEEEGEGEGETKVETEVQRLRETPKLRPQWRQLADATFVATVISFVVSRKRLAAGDDHVTSC